jgi:hypothetical protein
MKKVFSFVGLTAAILILGIWILNPVKAGTSDKEKPGKPIPENIMKIAEKSCVKCHTSGGNSMALSHVNLSKWNEMSPEKQAAKAADMCKEMTKDKMPPKSFRDKNPKGVPSKEEIKEICDWATSLEMPKK